MAVSVAKGNQGVCTTDAVRISVAKTHGTYATISAVASTTKNLRLAYPTAGSTGVYDTCNVVTAQLS